MHKHTPGPWSYRIPPDYVPHVEFWIDTPDGTPIADIKTHAKGATEADAKIIAAAPDLLSVAIEALGFVVATIQAAQAVGGRPFGPAPYEIETQLRATIAKATS